MNLGIKGRKALVTAGSRGIGYAIARALADEGAEVAIVSRTDPGTFRHFSYDLETSSWQMLVDLINTFGHPDIVVHNLGGTLGITEPLCSPKDWEKVYRLNLGVAVELNRAFIPYMQMKGWGRIVHVSSVAALENQGTVPYCSIKAALNAYTRSMGRVVAKDGVCISAVMPGAVFTEGGYWDHPRAEKFVDERMAIGRLGRAEEIGKVVAFLCSDLASFVVGSSFLVDGGQGRSFAL
jgi:NAD(P)-dependent dehydrogenase (short-subunit alcohol dehydrogenase family)